MKREFPNFQGKPTLKKESLVICMQGQGFKLKGQQGFRVKAYISTVVSPKDSFVVLESEGKLEEIRAEQ